MFAMFVTVLSHQKAESTGMALYRARPLAL